jgi:hypothetical protein
MHTSSLQICVLTASIMLVTPGRSMAQAVSDEQWPVSFESDGWQVQLFAPQPETLLGDRFKARAAVSLQRPADAQPLFGAIWGDGVLELDRSTRLGQLTAFTVTDARFPGLRQEELAAVKDMLTREIPLHTRPIPIDWLVAALEGEQEANAAYNNEAPEIIYRERPSVLVTIDGEAQYERIRNTAHESDGAYAPPGDDIERVVNTPFFMARWKGDEHYLYGSGHWYRADAAAGPWQPTTDVPSALNDLAAQVDTIGSDATASSTSAIPEVVVRNTPAELIDFDGAPQLKPLQHTNLLYATNSSDDVFLDIATQDYYLLASGRWYATRDLKNGPWRFVETDQLPTEFARIPEGSEKDGVLAHVPGTPAAREAVRDASIPQTARVDRNSASVEVTYDGEPRFERIAGTGVYEAVNASTTVLRIDGRYHVCDNAVWYDGPSPDGPWSVSTEVPSEVNDIPPTSAAYNTRYVYIYDHDPDWVYVGYTPGYMGCYVQSNVVIYGTGFYYRPWPHFWHPRPWTWGFNMYYDPWMGWSTGWSWGFNWFYPSWTYWGYYGAHPWYHGYPYGWWGPSGWCPPWGHGHHSYYGHRPSMSGRGSGGRTNAWDSARGNNLYAQRPNAAVRPSSVIHGRPSVAATLKPSPTKPVQRPVEKPRLDHYPDRDGTIYRGDGKSIDRYQDGKWQRMPKEKQPGRQRPSAITPPAQPRPQDEPQRIRQQRIRGDQRVQDMQRYQQGQRVAPRPQQQPRSAPRQSAPARSPGKRR